MSGQIASFRPGEKVPVTFLRDGKEKTVNITLKGEKSKIEISYTDIIGDRLGLELEELDAQNARKYEVDGGVIVKKIREAYSVPNR